MEDGDGRFFNLSISELISILRTSFRMSVFDEVEKVLVARERKLKEELDRKEKECEFLRRQKRKASLDEESDKRFELEQAKKGVEDKNFWKRREPWATLLQKYYPMMSDWEGNMIKKCESSSEQLVVGIREMIGEEEGPEKWKNDNANSAEGKNEGKVTDSDKKEQIAAAETFYEVATSSRTSKVDDVKNLQKKPGVKRKRCSFANSSDEIVNIDDDDDDDDEITESSKPSKKPQESNTDAGVILVEASSCRLNETKEMNTWTKQGATNLKVCDEHSLLKSIPQNLFLDSDDDDSVDDSSSSSDSDDDIHPLLGIIEGMM